MTDGAVPGRHWRDADGLHVDTRGLPPPDPMFAVLWHIEQPGQTGPIIVHLDRFPIHLLPELDARGWGQETASDEPGDVRLILRAKR
jgi:hypothetical protein